MMSRAGSPAGVRSPRSTAAMKQAHTTAADYFGGMVASYDSLIRRAVPRYEEMTARLLDYLPRTAAHVLELGCGTGNLSLALASRYPESRITLVDAAPEMIELTRSRLLAIEPEAARRIELVTARFEEFTAAPGTFDLVTSCISLHHVRDKGSLYRSLAAVIAPGGTLRFADQLRGGTEAHH